MKKVKSFFIFFNKRNKKLWWLFILSTIIYFSYEFSDNMEEWFDGADFIYNLGSELSLAFMGGFVFYMFQSEYSEFQKRRLPMDVLKPKLEKISDLIKIHIILLLQKNKKDVLDIENITNNQFKELHSYYETYSYVYLHDKNGDQIPVNKYMASHRDEILALIEKSYLSAGFLMDSEIYVVLDEIATSQYLESIDSNQKTKLGMQHVKPNPHDTEVIGRSTFTIGQSIFDELEGYYALYKKLDFLIDKIKKEFELIK